MTESEKASYFDRLQELFFKSAQIDQGIKVIVDRANSEIKELAEKRDAFHNETAILLKRSIREFEAQNEPG